jgi:hypothetical protein
MKEGFRLLAVKRVSRLRNKTARPERCPAKAMRKTLTKETMLRKAEAKAL